MREQNEINPVVLIARTDTITGQVLGSLLRSQGFKTQSRVECLDCLLARIYASQPDCLVVGSEMIEAADERALRLIRKVPTVLVCIKPGYRTDFEKLLDMGLNAYLSDLDEIEDLVECLRTPARRVAPYYGSVLRQTFRQLGIKNRVNDRRSAA